MTLIVRPAVNFDEGERYIVALRNLKDASGNTIEAGPAFRALRDGNPDPQVDARRAHFEQLFDTLGQAGIERTDLYLAWDFTVASRQSLSGRALQIRNQAFAELGDNDLSDLVPEGSEPQFTPNPDLPDNVPDEAEADGRRDLGDSIRISGNIRVPCFLNAPGCPPGSEFALGPDGMPQRIPGNTTLANVVCVIPKTPPAGALRPSLYGHGLLGGAGEVTGANVRAMANEHGFVFCATDWTGMSTLDVPNVLALLQDLSRFPTLADRAQQGFVNFMYVGRWMLKRDWGDLDVDQSRLFYDGNSQGGIMGGALTALAPDFDRAVLGVPGMNYSTLLRRSVDFDLYAHGNIEGADTPLGLYDSYPNELERPLLLSLIQLLWDRGEANGYAHHITDDPLPGHPGAQRAHARGVRGPPGGERDRRGGGAHDRGVRALAGARARAPHRREPVLRDPAPRGVPVRRLGDGPVGHRHPGASDHEHAAACGPGPAQRPAQQRQRRAGRSPSSCASAAA